MMDTKTNTATAASVKEHPSEVRQVLREEEMNTPERVSPQRTKQEPRVQKKAKPSNGIRELKEALAKARSQNQSLAELVKKREANSPVFKINEDSLDLEYSVVMGKQRYTATQPLVKGELAKALAPLLAPFIRVANALLQGHDLRELKEARVRDNDGRLTDQRLKLDGEQLYVANPIDDLRYQWKVLEKSETVKNAIGFLVDQAAFDGIDLTTCPGVTKGDSHRNSYDSGENVSSRVGETKRVYNPFFER